MPHFLSLLRVLRGSGDRDYDRRPRAPLLVTTPEQQERELRNARQGEADARAWRRRLIWMTATVIIWPLGGTVAILFATHTSHQSLGKLLFELGQLLGYTGFVLTVVYHFVNGMNRGEW